MLQRHELITFLRSKFNGPFSSTERSLLKGGNDRRYDAFKLHCLSQYSCKFVFADGSQLFNSVNHA